MKINAKTLRRIIFEVLMKPSDYRIIPIGDAIKEFPEAMKSWFARGGKLDDRVIFSDGALWIDSISEENSFEWRPRVPGWFADS